jgi:Protein of unknown function (DUF2796)
MRSIYHAAVSASLAAAVACPAPAFAQEAKRELGAHVHGQGAVDVAIEGNKVVLELRAPGADIVGFEGAAKTTRAKQALSAAISTLEKPLALFTPPEAAQCTVAAAKVEVSADTDHGRAAANTGTPAKHAHGGHGKHAQAKDEHTEFHADYALTCAKPELVTMIEFGFFKAFPKAQKLTVQIITAKGQTATEATPAKPRVEFGTLVK